MTHRHLEHALHRHQEIGFAEEFFILYTGYAQILDVRDGDSMFHHESAKVVTKIWQSFM